MMLALVVVGTRLSFRVIGEAAGALLLRELRNNARYDYQTVGFLDDDLSKTHKKMFVLPVLGDIDRLEAIIAEQQPEVLNVSTTKIEPARLARVQHVCYASGTTLLQMYFGLEQLPPRAAVKT